MNSLKNDQLTDWIKGFQTGSIKALSRLLTIIENEPEWCKEIFMALYPVENQPIIIGLTGAPGSGKSTVINQLLHSYKKDLKVAVLAFDPSSQSSGGAFFGDRERMKEHATNKNVFIRSIANRGRLGGLSAGIYDFLILLSAFGFQLIIIETVGTGQTEIDISKVADLTVLLLTPEFGDDLQILKAGIIEIADIFIINKTDLADCEYLKVRLKLFTNYSNEKSIPIIDTQARNGIGIDKLLIQIQATYQQLKISGLLKKRTNERLNDHIKNILERYWIEKIEKITAKYDYGHENWINVNPYLLTEELILNS